MKRLLKDIAVIGAGQGAPQGDSNYCDNGTPFVKAGNLIELLEGQPITEIQKVSETVAKKHKLKIYPKGTIIFAKSGMSCMKGYVYVLPQDAYVVSHLACIIPNDDISLYLRYYFKFHKPNQLVKDAAYPSISLSDIGNLEIDLKTVTERNSIVSQLQFIEKIMAHRQQELQKLDELVKARFVEMFGDFDLSYQKSEWPMISQIGTVVGGSTPKTGISEYWDGEYRWLSPAELKNDSGVICDSVRKITKAGVESCSLQELPVGTVILSSRAPIGKLAIAGNTFYCNQGFKNIICKDCIRPQYLYSLLLFNNDFLNSLGRGATFKEISKTIVENIRIPVPNIEEQIKFEQIVQQIDKSKVATQKALDEAQLLFDSLMQEYFD